VDNRICLITGATDGVGKATAQALAHKGFHLVLVARNPAKAARVRDEIQSTSAAPVEVIVGDLSRLADVARIAETFTAAHPRLDVLINNAGVMLGQRQITDDGLEATWQINYLSAFLLTQLLLGRLNESGNGRIINLSSSVYSIGKLGPDGPPSQSRYSAIGSYAASKLAILLFTVELAAHLQGTSVTANAVHPGVVRTQMLENAEGLFKLIALFASPFAITPEKGAAASVYLASSPDVQASGRYFAGGKAVDIKSRFNSPPIRGRLWDASVGALQHRGLL